MTKRSGTIPDDTSQLIKIEHQRLLVEQERLEVEKQRLAIEQRRLEIEEQRELHDNRRLQAGVQQSNQGEFGQLQPLRLHFH